MSDRIENPMTPTRVPMADAFLDTLDAALDDLDLTIVPNANGPDETDADALTKVADGMCRMFNLWLSEYYRRVSERAWTEGWNAGQHYESTLESGLIKEQGLALDLDDNPYKERKQR